MSNYPDSFNCSHDRTPMRNRDEDAILDDVNRLVRIKQDYLAVLDVAAGKVSKQAVEDFYVAAEESFDEMIYTEWKKLAEELRFEPEYPMSAHMRAWKMQSSFRPQPTRGLAPQNPSTLAAKGEGV